MNKFTKLVLTLGAVSVLSFLTAGTASANEAWQNPQQMSYSAGTVWWWPVGGAKWYNIYYSEAGDPRPMHAVRDLSQDARQYTIMYLKPGVSYKYQVVAKNDAGAEYWWGPIQWLKTWKMNWAPQTGGWSQPGWGY